MSVYYVHHMWERFKDGSQQLAPGRIRVKPGADNWHTATARILPFPFEPLPLAERFRVVDVEWNAKRTGRVSSFVEVPPIGRIGSISEQDEGQGCP